MKRLLAALLCAVTLSGAAAQDLRTYVPTGALTYCPELASEQLKIWPHAARPAFMCAQVEKESCIHLKHPRCWNPTAQLRTAREFGFGFGQTTIAYNADGSVRFDKQAELRAHYASLRGWTVERRFDAHYQLTAIVEMDHGIYQRIADAADDTARLAFTLSSYNGGETGVRQDRLLCRNTTGCDPAAWFDNVEQHSLKTRKPNRGYGASAFDINREYVRTILRERTAKYDKFFATSN